MDESPCPLAAKRHAASHRYTWTSAVLFGDTDEHAAALGENLSKPCHHLESLLSLYAVEIERQVLLRISVAIRTERALEVRRRQRGAPQCLPGFVPPRRILQKLHQSLRSELLGQRDEVGIGNALSPKMVGCLRLSRIPQLRA